MLIKCALCASVCLMMLWGCSRQLAPEAWYYKPSGVETRWSSFENPAGLKGGGGMENKGAKGHAFDDIDAGASRVLMDVQGSGRVTRMWLTITDRSPKMLRSLRIDMYWDGCEKAAVSAPLGDFFGVGLGRRVAMDTELFADAEGRSFVCYIPMPFQTGAKIVITNESDQRLKHLFYDVNYLLTERPDPNALYFHAHWRRENPNTLGVDYAILPKIAGKGRYLGCNIGVRTNPVYENAWWGEGEVKIYLDGDTDFPTLVGTGAEDYIGTAWGQGKYFNRYQGCTVADHENREWAMYRYHIPDPVYFDSDCAVTVQTIGGGNIDHIRGLQKQGAPMIPVSIDHGGGGQFTKLLDRDTPVDLHDKSLPGGHCNIYRQDDWSSTAYFYLDRPVNGLPELAKVVARVADLPMN